MGRIVAFSGRKTWTRLQQSGVEYAFACVFLVALNAIEKQILSKGGAGSSISKESSDKFKTDSAAADSLAVRYNKSGCDGGIDSRTSGSSSDVVVGILIEHPELIVRSQLAPEIHFLQEEPSFFLIMQLLATLGLILKISPDDFTLLVADSDVMPILQTVFRS